MAERQVGERLSEQAMERLTKSRRLLAHSRACPAMHDGSCTCGAQEAADDLRVVARQLAEAERENGRLREALVNIAHSYKLNIPGIAEQIARAALSPPDPPASPAEGSEA